MKVLFLGDSQNELVKWLKRQGEDVVATSDKVDFFQMKKISPEIIISCNYRYILPKNIIDYPKNGAINLHIAYLPWNRGADPNIWSHLENTPKGVTIHYMDEGIDTGDIIVQQKSEFDEDDTLRSSYYKLQHIIKELFKQNWWAIREGECPRTKQRNKGSIHYKKDQYKFKDLIAEKGWETPLKEIRGKLAKPVLK